MTYVSFCGGETAGSIGKRNINQVSFYGGETAGSIGKRTNIQTPQPESVNFKGHDNDDDSSVGSALIKTAAAFILAAGALGYAHKAGWISKIKNKNVKKYIDMIAKPCYKGYVAVKDFGVKYYNKIKGHFK